MESLSGRPATEDSRCEVAWSSATLPLRADCEEIRNSTSKTVLLDHHGKNREGPRSRRGVALKSQMWILFASLATLRLLSPWFIRAYEGLVLNIHPSLSRVPGLDAQKQALDHGEVLRVHSPYCRRALGPRTNRRPDSVPVFDGDTVQTLSSRILKEEHDYIRTAVDLGTQR